MGWVVKATPRPFYPRERPGNHCIGGVWDPGLVWTGEKNLVPTGMRSPDRPARNESLYRLSYPGPQNRVVHFVTSCTVGDAQPSYSTVLWFAQWEGLPGFCYITNTCMRHRTKERS